MNQIIALPFRITEKLDNGWSFDISPNRSFVESVLIDIAGTSPTITGAGQNWKDSIQNLESKLQQLENQKS